MAGPATQRRTGCEPGEPTSSSRTLTTASLRKHCVECTTSLPRTTVMSLSRRSCRSRAEHAGPRVGQDAGGRRTHPGDPHAGPWKLFRREFVEKQGIRFPEGMVRLEDGIFVTEAYVTARRVSIVAEYDYYRKRSQPDGGNISRRPTLAQVVLANAVDPPASSGTSGRWRR